MVERVFGLNLLLNMKREMTVAYKPGEILQKPMIRITNRYLLEAGFTVGSKFDVEYATDVIKIIRKKPKICPQN